MLFRGFCLYAFNDGAFLLVQPFIGFLTLAVLIGVFQIIRGIINLLISFGIKRNRKVLEMEMENLE